MANSDVVADDCINDPLCGRLIHHHIAESASEIALKEKSSKALSMSRRHPGRILS